MNKYKDMKTLIKYATITLGFISSLFFVFNFFLFAKLHPKMIRFEDISGTEENLLLIVGIGLVVFLTFYLLSLWRIANYLKNAKEIKSYNIILLIAGILSLLFVFSDWALLTDIHRQHKYGFDQPEWLLLYPIMIFQFITVIVSVFFHLFSTTKKNQLKNIEKDSNIFQIAQYVGITCGVLGLALSSLGFLYSRAWSLTIHSVMGPIILLTPYILVVIYWFVIKLQERDRVFYDEKQILDIGKSAFLTLLTSVIFMISLFITNFSNLNGIVSILWLPLYLFFVLFIFSSANLYYTKRS